MKRITVVSIVAASIIGVASGSALINPSPVETTEVTPIVQQVERHEAELDNHEERIINLEVSMDEPVDQTAPDNVGVSEPVAPQVTPAPSTNDSSVKIVVISSKQRIEELPVEANHLPKKKYYCDLEYSDGSSETQYMGLSSGKTATFNDTCHEFVGKEKVT